VKNYILLLLFIFINNTVHADYVRDHFFVTEKVFDFEKKLVNGKCSGSIKYPILSNEDEEITDETDKHISHFIETYAICNKGKRKNFSVSYEFPDPKSFSKFSIIWKTKKGKKLWRIDSLTFKFGTGVMIDPSMLFNNLSQNLLSEIIKTSDGHLKEGIRWEQFVDKINNRDIQFYFQDNRWRIVFNPTRELDKIVDIEIPNYFMQG
jgi:hypothetical protein